MKRIIILIALACNMLCAAAHTNISHSIAKYIEKNIGFIDSLQIANIEKMNDKGDSLTFKNGFNEDTSIRICSSSFATLTLNKTTSVDAILFPHDSTATMCIITTYKRPVLESAIQFYDTEANAIDNNFNLPNIKTDVQLSQFIQKPDTMSLMDFDQLSKSIEPYIFCITYLPQQQALCYQLTPALLSKEEKTKTNAIIKQRKFKWNGHLVNEY